MRKLAHVQWQCGYLGVHQRHPVDLNANLTLMKRWHSELYVSLKIVSVSENSL